MSELKTYLFVGGHHEGWEKNVNSLAPMVTLSNVEISGMKLSNPMKVQARAETLKQNYFKRSLIKDGKLLEVFVLEGISSDEAARVTTFLLDPHCEHCGHHLIRLHDERTETSGKISHFGFCENCHSEVWSKPMLPLPSH